MKNRLLIVSAIVITALFAGCYYDIESDLYPAGNVCDILATSFSADVYPIISSKCLGCHDAASNSGSITLETHSQIKAQADNGDLGCSINHGSGCSSMPKNAPQLPPCELQAINAWITAGALDN